ncbi:hypothetical protein [Streptomyces yaizuensis]|uniref:Hydroxyisourate hydrolase n=1 Tax=Streptomyces yaizuensis TaxID=2989713 RepID=A0ABQ5NYA1_9ACTN|nr:hypothetical protein [Streptomyces sp. YSPA8]GLF95165.1 hydroxyisourate hydrolase [Streptomyces sp. YSPA8]
MTRRILVSTACATALLAGTVTVPSAFAGSSVRTAASASECQNAVPTYVHDRSGATAVLRKYLDWDPLTGNTNGSLHNTGVTAPLDTNSMFFTASTGLIYEITNTGVLKAHKDRSATGGSLLTPVRDHGTGWNVYSRVWSGGESRVFALNHNGELDVYMIARAPLDSGAFKKLRTLPASSAAATAFRDADDVWAVGTTVYSLKRGTTDGPGTVRSWKYIETDPGAKFSVPTTVYAGVGVDTLRGWSPGPGTFYTVGSDSEYTGVVSSYTGTGTVRPANPDVAAGFQGDVHAEAAPCLASPSPDIKPVVGPDPSGTEVPPPAVNDNTPDPAPQNPTEFTGTFVLGDGRPAAGLPVRVEALDITSDSDAEHELTTLGTTVTGADGTWKVTLPATLPEPVRLAAAENGGAINAMATVNGQTPTGQIMRGTDMVTAAPASAPATARALAATAAADNAEPTKLRPITADMFQEQPQPPAARTAQSWASKDELNSADTLGDRPLPEYQSDVAGLPQGDPYVINGVDTKAMEVKAFDGGCDKTKEQVIERKINYTTVGEGHAWFDAGATVEYENKMASNVEVAVKTGSRWTIEGSVTLGSSIGHSTGYAKRGPYFAKQWQVPIEYKKIRETWKCDYGKITMYRYKIVAGKYKIPRGGAVGKFGKDVRDLDGPTNYGRYPAKNRSWVEPGSFFQITKNRSTKWSGAVSAFGVKLGGSTQYDKDHKQRIDAGTKRSPRHDIWGKNDRVDGKPGVFYSW